MLLKGMTINELCSAGVLVVGTPLSLLVPLCHPLAPIIPHSLMQRVTGGAQNQEIQCVGPKKCQIGGKMKKRWIRGAPLPLLSQST